MKGKWLLYLAIVVASIGIRAYQIAHGAELWSTIAIETFQDIVLIGAFAAIGGSVENQPPSPEKAPSHR